MLSLEVSVVVSNYPRFSAYAAVKYRDDLIQSLQYVFPSRPLEDHVRNANTLIVHALRIGTWGSDFHMFPLSLLLDRPIFMYVYFSSSDEDGVRTIILADIDNVNVFAQMPLLQVRDNTYSGAVVCIDRGVARGGQRGHLPPLFLCRAPPIIVQNICLALRLQTYDFLLCLQRFVVHIDYSDKRGALQVLTCVQL